MGKKNAYRNPKIKSFTYLTRKIISGPAWHYLLMPPFLSFELYLMKYGFQAFFPCKIIYIIVILLPQSQIIKTIQPYHYSLIY